MDEVVSMVNYFDISSLVGVHCSKVGITLGFPLDFRDEEAASSFRGTILEVLAMIMVKFL